MFGWLDTRVDRGQTAGRTKMPWEFVQVEIMLCYMGDGFPQNWVLCDHF